MRTTCQNCGESQPLEAGFLDDDGKRLAMLCAEMEPVLGRAVLAYLPLFKPAVSKLRTARAVKIVQQLAVLIDAGTVCRDERGGIRRKATPAMWAEGIDQILANLRTVELPLANHNYLRAVVFGLADAVDADAERRKEADMRVGKHRQLASENVDPARERIAYLRQQLEYEQIDQVTYDAEVRKASEGKPR